MKTMHIYTNEYRRTVYHVDMKTGNIWYDGLRPSGDWKFVGFYYMRSHWRHISFKEIQEKPEIVKESWFWFKNGKSQYLVRDLDHGTLRQWGSRITGISFSD